jgi:phage FluMu gp28-like protein
LDYLRQLWEVFSDRNLVVVAKSRQMLVSWVVAAFCVWVARSKPHQAVFWQAQKQEDAVSMVCNPEGAQHARCQFIEANLPPWMRISVKPVEGRLVYPNGSVIQALAGGADKIRGKTASLIVLDEFAHFEEQTGVYTSIAPLIQKGAKAIIVSTPNGSTNLFATLYHGRPVNAETA